MLFREEMTRQHETRFVFVLGIYASIANSDLPFTWQQANRVCYWVGSGSPAHIFSHTTSLGLHNMEEAAEMLLIIIAIL